MKMNILILTSDAGFGHRKAAEALAVVFQQTYADEVEVTIANPFDDDEVPDIVRNLESGYDEMVTEDPTFYQLAYAATDAPVVAQLMQQISTTVLLQTMRKVIRAHQPDAIITTYPAYIQAAIRARDELNSNAPVAVVVTDLITVHSLWFHKRADLTFVPTGHVMKQAKEQGLKPNQLMLSGLPVHPDVVTEERDKAELRRDLNWEVDMDTILVVGSTRARQTANIARLLDQSGLEIQVAAIAGGDQELKERLDSIAWRGCVHVYGFVDNMPEMMHAADMIACKAGGLIVTESLAVGLPLILYQALPGQEVGNVRYVVESGAGAWSPGPIGVLTTAYAWLTGDKAELKKFRAAARRVGKPRAAFDIADRVMKAIR